MFKQIFRVVLIFLVFWLSVEGAHAKGAPARITIEGPGISGKLEITDEELLAPFGWGEFADFSTPVDERTHTAGGYTLTRYVLMGGTTLRSLDTFTYFPGQGDERGVVYYKGIIDKKFIYGGSPYDGQWFRVSTEGESAFQRIVQAYGIPTREDSFLNLVIPVEMGAWLSYGFLLAAVGLVIIFFGRRKWLHP